MVSSGDVKDQQIVLHTSEKTVSSNIDIACHSHPSFDSTSTAALFDSTSNRTPPSLSSLHGRSEIVISTHVPSPHRPVPHSPLSPYSKELKIKITNMLFDLSSQVIVLLIVGDKRFFCTSSC